MPRYFIFIWSAIQLIHLLTFDWWVYELDLVVRAFMLIPAAGLAVLLFSPPSIIRVAILTLTFLFLGAWIVLLFWKVSYRDESREKHWLEWILPVLFTINTLQPHIGGKTALAFDMFSNLRTEPGYANHLILQPCIGLTTKQGFRRFNLLILPRWDRL